MLYKQSFQGKIQVYTGCGKGKTTAAVGLAIRAYGQGLRVSIIQFMKTGDSGEIKFLKAHTDIPVFSYGIDAFSDKASPNPLAIREARKALDKARELIKQKRQDALILDEINCAAWFNLISVEDIVSLIKERPEDMELILTGRYADEKIIRQADLVTEMKEIKHPWKNGLEARKGIEY